MNLDTITAHEHQIICPNCHATRTAVVEHTFPWWTYIHHCDCGFTIMESDWSKVDRVIKSE